MTPSALTKREDRLFDALLSIQGDPTFEGVLYRDGVPRPDIYLKQAVRVVFVFREPNLGHKPFDMDMRAQIRDPEFRAAGDGTPRGIPVEYRYPGSIRGWWNSKVAAFGHAVVHAFQDGSPAKSFAAFQRLIADGQRTHDFLFPFGFIQIKKVGGGGTSNPEDITRFARQYRRCLKEQIEMYEPHLIIGCGMPPASPARLLNEFVLPGGEEQRRTRHGKLVWWRYQASARPVAMLEFNHPSFRGSREKKYCALMSAVREISGVVGFRD